MPDLLLAAANADAGIAFAAGITTALVRETRARHDLAPTASAAVGRLITAAALLGTGLKGSERISLQVAGSGPIGVVAAEAWLLGEGTVGARARAANPRADLPPNGRGKLDVAGVVGTGHLHVMKTFASGPPYVGVVPLQTGEIAEDVAAYLAQSEQIPSVVALGVLADPDGIRAAGGTFAHVQAGADERAVAALEARALQLRPVTTLVAEGLDARGLLHEIAGDLALRSHRTMDVAYACLCSREKVEAALLGLGAEELESMALEEETEAACDYCRKSYAFAADEIRALARRASGDA